MLEAVTLSGNPVAHVPSYRHHVISACPQLSSLDGHRITPADRQRAEAALATEQTALNLMVQNDALITKLTAAVRRVAVHGELVLTFPAIAEFRRRSAVSSTDGSANEGPMNSYSNRRQTVSARAANTRSRDVTSSSGLDARTELNVQLATDW